MPTKAQRQHLQDFLLKLQIQAEREAALTAERDTLLATYRPLLPERLYWEALATTQPRYEAGMRRGAQAALVQEALTEVEAARQDAETQPVG